MKKTVFRSLILSAVFLFACSPDIVMAATSSLTLTVSDLAGDNIFSGADLNSVAMNNGVIDFVNSAGEVAYAYSFKDWKAKDSDSYNLTIKYDIDESSSYPDTYTLRFKYQGVLPGTVDFRLQTGMPSAAVYLYETDQTGIYKEICTSETDTEGFFETDLNELGDYTVSFTDIAGKKSSTAGNTSISGNTAVEGAASDVPEITENSEEGTAAGSVNSSEENVSSDKSADDNTEEADKMTETQTQQAGMQNPVNDVSQTKGSGIPLVFIAVIDLAFIIGIIVVVKSVFFKY